MNKKANDLKAATANKILAQYGKSFHWASYLLPADVRRQAAILYAFCRYLDDIVDENNNPAAALAELNQLRAEVRQRQSSNPHIMAFLVLVETVGIDFTVIEDLLAGVASDVGGQQLQDEAALLKYCYQVAGTVGLMMTKILNVQAAEANIFAVDLGIAMQMSNIARDVLVDAKNNRLYIPRTWLPADFTLQTLLAGNDMLRQKTFAAIERLLGMADSYYYKADKGLPFIARRSRLAILIASRVYQGIGKKIIRQGATVYWERRTVVSKSEKLWITLNAIIR